MIQADQIVQEGLSGDIHLLGDILGRVIRRQAGVDVFDLEERFRALAKARRSDNDPAITAKINQLVQALSAKDAENIARAFTIYFQLVNVAEDQQRARVLRKRARQAYPRPLQESIKAAIAELWRLGTDDEEMGRLLDRLHIEPVFTAHPTEAKRRTILSKLGRIAEDLQRIDQHNLLPHELSRVEQHLLSEVTTLWLTSQSRVQKPTVEDEVKTGLYYFENTIWEAVPQIYREMAEALATYYPRVKIPERFLSFGSWIGGDRDGNPNVTAWVTAETMRLHRGLGITLNRRKARQLDRALTVSSRLTEVTDELQAAVTKSDNEAEHVAFLREQYPQEPYRLLAAMLRANLDEANQDPVKRRLLGEDKSPMAAIRNGDDLRAPLDLLHRSLLRAGAKDVTEAELADTRYQAEVFGLHMARLDFRQYSDLHDAVLGEVFSKLGVVENYEALSVAEKTDLLTQQLSAETPDLTTLADLSEQTAEMLMLFTVIGNAVALYGPEVIGPYIISMTTDMDDMLAVLLFGKWHRLCLQEDSDIAALAITPLFETREDLVNAPRVMTELFAHPAYSRHLALQDKEQNIMIGYSDSNKDAGYLTAQWELYQAQERVGICCRDHGVGMTLFHGRGGTMARGGGPANRAILAQPPGTVDGRIRITVQGEVINARYSQVDIANRHLQQLVNAVMMSSTKAHTRQATPQAAWREAMDEMALTAFQQYRTFVYETPAVLQYWQEATPINELSGMRIGSRPSRRKGGDVFASLRAIPWGFSWMQSRHVLPGWYGVGEALATFVNGGGEQGLDDRLALLQEMYRQWPFFQTMIDNVQVSLGKADMGIARLYADLVKDETVRETVYGAILASFELTRKWVILATEQNDVLDNQQVLNRSIRLRNPYVDPLNFIQVDLLKRVREMEDKNSDEAVALHDSLYLTINGVAAGLKNTG